MSLLNNIKRAKFTLLGIGVTTYLLQYYATKVFLKNYVFGIDGNGGDMLNIYTYLSDQEMAHLRLQKRVSWHNYKLDKDHTHHLLGSIPNEELEDMGIDFPRDRSVEYNKRPPHDFYV